METTTQKNAQTLIDLISNSKNIINQSIDEFKKYFDSSKMAKSFVDQAENRLLDVITKYDQLINPEKHDFSYIGFTICDLSKNSFELSPILCFLNKDELTYESYKKSYDPSERSYFSEKHYYEKIYNQYGLCWSDFVKALNDLGFIVVVEKDSRSPIKFIVLLEYKSTKADEKKSKK